MPEISLKPTHKSITNYYTAVAESGQLGLYHEGAVAPHFAALLRSVASSVGWTLQEQYQIPRKDQHALRADGALLDKFTLVHGIWEAKDRDDDLEKEVKSKFQQGYPKDNILFQSPGRAMLYQDGRLVIDTDITRPEALVEVLKRFFGYERPAYVKWDQAVVEFKDKVPQLAQSLLALIETERQDNSRFKAAFDDFTELVRESVNPNIAMPAVEEMLIQHLLTERIFRKVFNNPDFATRNIVAREIEKVIDALTSRSFSRHEFLGNLDYFYSALDTAAATIDDYSEKQSFLNTVYEQFFQGFSVKVADTHGIVYTPQAIVDFMVRSVDDILRREFGKSDGLAADQVAVLDPFVGTGNFILRVMREMPRSRLPRKYRQELFCNEVMLLPYYIASMNIEHAYYELTGQYEPFTGIALVDTFELAESRQMPLFVKENTQRLQRQKDAPIFVIIGNPPYNAKQVNENDNSKNRKYPVMDKRVAETYAADSTATNRVALSDPYVKAFRWASDRLGAEGIVALVTNNSYLDGIAFDGMRQHLLQDFSSVYVLDLGGNVRLNPKLSGTTHNVFGIQVGVSICLLVRQGGNRPGRVYYARAGEEWTRYEKYDYLDAAQDWQGIEWRELAPDRRNTWLTAGLQRDFEHFPPMGSKETKGDSSPKAIFANLSNGVKTNRDAWAYNFDRAVLTANMQRTIDFYNEHVYRRQRVAGNFDADSFVSNEDKEIGWSRDLKLDLKRGHMAEFSTAKIRQSLYRPFTQNYLYFDRIMNEEVYQMPQFFPTPPPEDGNWLICVNRTPEKPFASLMTRVIPDLVSTGGFGSPTQCFPFYTYDEDGRNRRENITDWALGLYRATYGDATISKWDIFHAIYAVLHHPAYRETYAANLRRELPRIPFVEDFRGFARAGAQLAELHVNYETQPEYPLPRIEDPDERLDWRVAKMRLSKDRTTLRYNDFLTLGGIPARAFEYKLGNRSALEWVIDQYQVSTDKRSGITNDPNRRDDPEYIVGLIGRVITVSLETLDIIEALPPLAIRPQVGAE